MRGEQREEHSRLVEWPEPSSRTSRLRGRGRLMREPQIQSIMKRHSAFALARRCCATSKGRIAGLARKRPRVADHHRSPTL